MWLRALTFLPAVIIITFSGCLGYEHSVQQVRINIDREDISSQNYSDSFITLAAGKKYQKNPVHRFIFGKHYRSTWATPVTMPVLDLQSEQGGLTIIKQSGSRQTIGLRLKDSAGQEWVLRSIDKNPAGLLPASMQKSFLAEIVNDMNSASIPYGAFMLVPMEDAIGIYHANPKLVYIPHDPILGEFLEEMSGMMALLEERPDDDASEQSNFGNAKKIKSTGSILTDRFEDNDKVIDAEFYLKNRLFDMLIGDWSRHEDNWRWAEYKENGQKIYKAIPRDRDNVFFRFDGLLPQISVMTGFREHFRTFKPTEKNIVALNRSGRKLDEAILLELSWDDWENITKDLQLALTDSIIEQSVKQMPAEVFAIEGAYIIKALKQRRDDMLQYAKQYFESLNERPYFIGSDKHERFKISQNGDSTVVKIYAIKKDGEEKHLIAERVFYPENTKSIAFYGLAGEDRFKVDSNDGKIKIFINGGAESDIYDITNTTKKNNIIIKDSSKGNDIHLSGKAKMNLLDNPPATTFTSHGWLLQYYIWD